MKWIPLSERKPTGSFASTNTCIFTNGIRAVEDGIKYIPEGMTHCLDLEEMPPLPAPEKLKDPYWEEFESKIKLYMKGYVSLDHFVVSLYEFLKAKYGE